MAEECLDEVNERSSFSVTAAFTDEDGDPVTPTAATVRIDDERSKTEIRGTQALSSLAEEMTIEISSGENRILKTRSKSEIRIVTLEWDYDGGAKHGVEQYRYRLLNLYGAAIASSPSMSPSASASPSV